MKSTLSMKRILIIGLIFLSACKGIFQTKQEKAEAAVRKYLHVADNSDSAKRMHFTTLEDGRLGLYDGAKFRDTIRSQRNGKLYHTVFIKTLWFQLDPSCTKVKIIYTN
jgi:hypothetical protein